MNGVAAGLSTKSNKIGFVAAKPIAIVLSNINSFLLGARSVNPNATVQVIFTGDWSLPVREAEAANALVDAGCDVITCHVDGPKVVIETAEKRGVKTCGHNASQAPLAPKGFITGAEYKWETIYKGYAADLAEGKTLPNFVAGGYEVDFVQNTPFGAGATRAGEEGGDRRDRGPEGEEADLCRPAQGQQDRQGRDRQDLRQSRSVPRQDGLSARGRRRLDDLTIAAGRTASCRTRLWRPAPPRDLIGAGSRKAGSDYCAEAARQLRICRHSAACARDRGGAVRALPPGDRQVAGRFRRLCLARRLRHGLLLPEHAAALGAADPDRARGRDPGAHRPHHDRRRGRAGARRLRRRGRRDPADRRRAADPHAHRSWRRSP